MQTIVRSKSLLTDSGVLPDPWLLIEDGKIADLDSSALRPAPAAETTLSFPEATLAPSFFDVHIHGGMGHDLMDATPESMRAVSTFLGTHGVGQFLATTVTASMEATLRALNGLARLMNQQQPGAQPVGIHLEGPFLSHAKRGVHPPQHLKTADIGIFQRFWEAAEGKIRLMTLAPEIEGACELAAHATALGVRVSIGHSNADAATSRSVIAAGATSATHTFNAMRPLDHREPGILGTVLSDDNLFAELICDGIHVRPELVKVWWRAKGAHRAILVTDAMSATGMPDGTYMLGEFAVEVKDGCAMSGGVLAGSVLTMDRALVNFIQFAGVDLQHAVPLLTRNPRSMAGFEKQTGSLIPGADASFVALDASGALLASVIRGQALFNAA